MNKRVSKGRRVLDKAPDWFGCGRVITRESWNGFLQARNEYYARKDAERGLSPDVAAPRGISVSHPQPTGATK